MRHTAEPWAAFGKQVIETVSADRKIIVQCKTEEDAERIVDCVNAMQGIEDPEPFMQTALTYKSWALQAEQKCDTLRRQARLLAEQLDSRVIGTAISDSKPDPNNPGQHVVDVELFKYPADYGR
jgi:hypothetical protein